MVCGSGSGGSSSGGSGSGGGGGGSVYYQNCAAARAAGATPVRRGDPGYASHLDRDGTGCDWGWTGEGPLRRGMHSGPMPVWHDTG
ncbi:excalibur calcium-binding domain-containing protein [Streptomyces hirsutus]|uniref:Excalibur calcium-binding domain-containing protein n=2 Tax=Streptomyces hirsutus TaxID=35620 RepID=A0ABZ1H2V6_9ACTN|nr:excalibur calcium-binding domain-containing protein [Streptomyces hirsutus]WSD11710.1 excalibur calcium-binding domain-containing protein [Streptomyces hirsutus]WTD22334.1 excalibur calcium-binding domain-containing protein [Streptomyces hirsutus]WTD22844.1 excalibur calcium-binding domain-containing protein [Streptomyces hirsutus]